MHRDDDDLAIFHGLKTAMLIEGFVVAFLFGLAGMVLR